MQENIFIQEVNVERVKNKFLRQSPFGSESLAEYIKKKTIMVISQCIKQTVIQK